jgi:hypothetical protein
MSETETWDQLTPEDQQKLIDDFCRGWVLLCEAFGERARATIAAFNNIPPEVRAAILDEDVPADVNPELPEPDQVIEKNPP